MVTTIARIDECLSKRDGHLFVEECDTSDLIQQSGSPLFVLSEDQLRRNVRRRETEDDVFRRDVIPEHLQG